MKLHELTEKLCGPKGFVTKYDMDFIIRSYLTEKLNNLMAFYNVYDSKTINRILGLSESQVKDPVHFWNNEKKQWTCECCKPVEDSKMKWCEEKGQNFFKYVDMPDEDDDCWEWVGGKNAKGYGYYYDGEKNIRAHRYAYTKAIGNIPSGLVVMHSCDNVACVNPSHLSVGTMADNIRDREAKGRGAKGEKHGAYKDGSRVGEPRNICGTPHPKEMTLREVISERFREHFNNSSLTCQFGTAFDSPLAVDLTNIALTTLREFKEKV